VPEALRRHFVHAVMLLNAGRFRIQRLSVGGIDSRRKRRMWAARADYYRSVWRAASEATGISAKIGDNGVIEMRRGELCLTTRDNVTQLEDPNALLRADDKQVTHRLLSRGGIPVPRHVVVNLGEYDRALSHLLSQGGPVVVKPAASTGGGAGVTTNVFTAAQLRSAMARSRTFCRDILIEQQIEGDCYRILLMDGKHIDSVLRLPPTVVGDGRSTVRQLLRRENERRLEQGAERSQVLIGVDRDVTNTLARQGLGLWSRPASGAVVRLKQAVNENALQENAPAGGLLCRDIIETARKAAELVGVRLAGVDVVCRDPSIPLRASGGAIVEVNTHPGLYYHNVEGRGPLVAKKILEAYFGVGHEATQLVNSTARDHDPAIDVTRGVDVGALRPTDEPQRVE
jgi:cyanophycin synthetase